MSFKDVVESDRDVFLNLDEFGDEHEVEGEKITVVLTETQIEDFDSEKALSQSTLNLYAKTEEMPAYKNTGETLYIDDVGYTVDSWIETMGITKVILRMPEGY